MSETRKITQINNTRSDLQSNLNNHQIAVETNQSKSLVWKDGSGNYRICADSGSSTLTSGRIVFGGSTGALTQDSNLLWDNSNKRFGLGSGATSPDSLFHAMAGSAGSLAADAKAVGTFENSDDCLPSILTPNDKKGGIYCCDPDASWANAPGKLFYDHANDVWEIYGSNTKLATWGWDSGTSTSLIELAEHFHITQTIEDKNITITAKGASDSQDPGNILIQTDGGGESGHTGGKISFFHTNNTDDAGIYFGGQTLVNSDHGLRIFVDPSVGGSGKPEAYLDWMSGSGGATQRYRLRWDETNSYFEMIPATSSQITRLKSTGGWKLGLGTDVDIDLITLNRSSTNHKLWWDESESAWIVSGGNFYVAGQKIRTGGNNQLDLGDDSSILSIGQTNTIWGLNDVDLDELWYINYCGYNGGTTRFRDLAIINGKGDWSTPITKFDGVNGRVGIEENSPDAVLDVNGTFMMKEQAAAITSVAGKGQLWIKNTTPCELWFTDDAGTSTKIV